MKSVFVFIVMSLLFVRCGKDGAIGPEGEKAFREVKGQLGKRG